MSITMSYIMTCVSKKLCLRVFLEVEILIWCENYYGLGILGVRISKRQVGWSNLFGGWG